MTPPAKSPTRWILQVCGGIGWLFFCAYVLSHLTDLGWLQLLVALFLCTCVTVGLSLLLLTRWALRAESRIGQFGVGTTIVIVTLVSLGLSLVRWLTDHVELAWSSPFVGMTLLCFFLFGCGIRLILPATESLAWLAVWIVRRPAIQRWLIRQRRR